MPNKLLSTIFLSVITLTFTACNMKQTVVPQADGTYKVSTSYFNNDAEVTKEDVVQQSYKTAHTEQVNTNLQISKEYMKIANQNDVILTAQKTFEGTINSLATQMMRNQKLATDKPVLITSFVRLDALKKTTEFGRVISESLINEMSNRGFNMIEFRGQTSISINDEGEYFISRKPHELKDRVPNTYIVVGTYSRQVGKVMINARVIDNITGVIITSARATYEHGYANDCLLFGDCKPARSIGIVKER